MTEFAVTDRHLNQPTGVAAPGRDDILAVMHAKYGPPESAGPAPRLWYRVGYATPDEYYEALIANLATDGCDWLDVGCGRNIFPSNRELAQTLSERCAFLMGLDPDPTIDDNTLVHEKRRTTIEHLDTDRRFDLITLRMVAEHIAEPASTAAALARLCKPKGRVVVYTVSRSSPLALAAWLVPFRWHNSLKRVLWQTLPEDTFPVHYRMNTRAALTRHFVGAGFSEVHFAQLADCRVLFRFNLLHRIELAGWRVCRYLRIRYPESCILAVYQRT
jgi:SAM-dependent methyltransferase